MYDFGGEVAGVAPRFGSAVAGAEVAAVQESGGVGGEAVGGEAVGGVVEAAVSGEQAGMHALTAEVERLKELAARQEAMLGEQDAALKGLGFRSRSRYTVRCRIHTCRHEARGGVW